jgi:NAD-dependent dihydropyrimidine dehydrogenase PreA subunit
MKITICACASRTFIDKEKVAQIAAAAKQAGMDVEIVGDLCELCETQDERLQVGDGTSGMKVHEIAQSTIVACHPKAVKSLLAFAGEPHCQSIDIRQLSLEDALQALGISAAPESASAEWREQIEAFPSKLGEDAWYPTLDKDACAECGKCYEFCPFGVYEMVNDRVTVVQPQNCKNNCPACARQCPTSAIIFPKYDRSPINGGEEMQESAVRLDSKELYGEVLRKRLIERKTNILKK